MSLTDEAKLRILFRLVRSAAEVVPCARELKVLAETIVDVADEVRKGRVQYSIEAVDRNQDKAKSTSKGAEPDLSLSILWRELKFAHISFGAEEFKSLLVLSGAIQLERCLIVQSRPSTTIHLDTLPGLKGAGQFLDSRLVVEHDKAILTTPAANMYDPGGIPSNRHQISYDGEQTMTLGSSAWRIESKSCDSLSSEICSQLAVAGLKCVAITFALVGRAPNRHYSVCIVRSDTC
jgi:hypothetical protein